jgi:hypothetical protein
MNPATQNSPLLPVATRADSAALIAHLGDVMERLLALLEQETAFVRAGRLGDASRLEAVKTELAHEYIAATARMKASRTFLASAMPDAVASLRERLHMFEALLQINLTVLATAHAVSEGIMRGVSDAVNRKASPQTYGAGGRTVAPPRGSAQPLTVSRVL